MGSNILFVKNVEGFCTGKKIVDINEPKRQTEEAQPLIVNKVHTIFGGPTSGNSNHARRVHYNELPSEQEVLSKAQSQGKGI